MVAVRSYLTMVVYCTVVLAISLLPVKAVRKLQLKMSVYLAIFMFHSCLYCNCT